MIQGHYRYDKKIYAVIGTAHFEKEPVIICIRKGRFKVVSAETFNREFNKIAHGYQGGEKKQRWEFSIN
jgi:hypothetical protein